MVKKIPQISVLLSVMVLFIQLASGLTASSENYSVNIFGTGLATSNPSSINYNSTILSEPKGTTRNAESETYTANIGFFEDTTYHRTVSITSYSISPKSAVIGSTIGLSISALNYQSVWATITSPNSQEQTLNLINGQTVSYVPNPSVVGRYNVIFYANSSTGAIASVVDYFDLTEQITPTPSTGSSGGGGTTTIIEKCTYNWDCTPWSVCSGGKQTRTCKNVGTCVGTESKPIEEMSCSESLFDIILRLEDVKITENKTLKFKIELTEKIGAERIDAHIKYSIINNEDYEIFSQIETKAIQGSLTYEKEIGEIRLADGEYTLRVDVLYGNLQRAFAEQKIKVLDGKIETNPEPLPNIPEKTGITGRIINNLPDLFSFEKGTTLTFWIIIPIFVLLIILRKKLALVYKKIAKSLSRMSSKYEKYSHNSIKGLVNKKVYSERGDYIGRIKDVVLGENKIDSIKIKIDKKHKFKVKGIIIEWKQVVNCGEIMIINLELPIPHTDKNKA